MTRTAGSVLIAAVTLAGCANQAPRGGGLPAPGLACLTGKPMTETVLFFGLSSPKGPVSGQAFQRFTEAEVTPRWQTGYTVVDAQGYWYSERAKRTDHEASRVVIRVHEGGADESAAIEAIRMAYKTAFTQESVLRVDRLVCASF